LVEMGGRRWQQKGRTKGGTLSSVSSTLSLSDSQLPPSSVKTQLSLALFTLTESSLGMNASPLSMKICARSTERALSLRASSTTSSSFPPPPHRPSLSPREEGSWTASTRSSDYSGSSSLSQVSFFSRAHSDGLREEETRSLSSSSPFSPPSFLVLKSRFAKPPTSRSAPFGFKVCTSPFGTYQVHY